MLQRSDATPLKLLCHCRYQHARLLKRDTDAGQATVQLLSTYEAVQVSFDDVSEYMGDAAEDE